MKTVYDIKQALDPDLYVRAVPVWQAERRMREGRKYPDNLIYLSSPWMDEPQEDVQRDTISSPIRFRLAFAAAALCLGLICCVGKLLL